MKPRAKRNALGAIAALMIAACSEVTTPSPTGSLKVSVETAGGDPDEDGYLLVIDDDRPKYVPPSSSRLFDSLVAGTHVLKLSGIADNCTLDGPPSRSVTVAAGETSEVAFATTCDATGIEIRTRTTGPDQPSGYQLKIVQPLPMIGERHGSVGTSGTFVTSRLKPGIHTVTLFVLDNCTATGGNVATVTVSNRAVTPVTFEITCTPVDKQFAFVQDSVAGNFYFGTFVVVAGGSGSVGLRIPSAHSPAWSPDGTRLAYSSAACDYYYGLPCTGGVLIIDVETRISSAPPSGGLGVDPSWSRDGKLIAFSRLPKVNSQTLTTLHVSGLTDLSSVELPTPGVHARHPSWSPDGERIAFQCFGRQPGSDICMINKDGTGFKKLTERGGWNGTPSWSPDGSRIAFGTDQFSGGTAVALMNPDGTGVTRVTAGWDPAWSPDGSKLIFAQASGLFTIGADGSNLTPITTGRHYAPAWRP